MIRTLVMRVALGATMVLASMGAQAQGKDFNQLKQIEGVEHVHIGKFLLNLASKNDEGELDLGEDLSFNIKDGDLLKKIDDIRVFNTEEESAVVKMSKKVKSVLSGKGWEPLIDIKDEDGQKVKMYQAKRGKHSTMVIFAEEDDEASLVVITGKVDFAELVAQEMNEEEKAQKMSLSVKTHQWEDDDEDKKEPRKFRDCLIVIDGKVYPNLHTQTEAAKYIYEHNMEWNGIPKVLEGKDVKKKYPDTKKKVAFEYTTTNNNPNI